ncbi:MAG: ribose-phosphate pyrophosphokinase [Candidatus Promineifilaceae bacterium]
MTEALIEPSDIRFFSGSSHPQLAAGITQYLRVPLDDTIIRRFSNDNLYVQLGASVRGRRVYLVQSLFPPVNDHLVELLMMIDIARSAAAKEIHAIIPYFSFARSDKKDAPRISITAKLVASLLETAGATHFMTMMLHSPQVHGFFGIPADPLTARPVFENYFRERDLSSTIVVAPDVSHAKSAGRFAGNLELPVAAGNKERLSDTSVKITGLVGRQVQGFKKAIIYDDEIATGTSVIEMSDLLARTGIEEIAVVCTHGVFVRNALQRLSKITEITEIVTSDTVRIPLDRRTSKLKVLAVAHIFGEAIRRNYRRESIDGLFVYGEE